MSEKTETLCSRASARRFVKLFLSLNDTEYWYHQTLTFGDSRARENIDLAQSRLKRLLDAFEKTAEFKNWTCIWVREYQQSKGIHYHILFLFYGGQESTPEKHGQKLRNSVYNHWYRINAGKVVAKANALTLPNGRARSFKSLGYLMKEVSIVENLRRGMNWNGCRRKNVLNRNSSLVAKKDVTTMLRRVLAQNAPETYLFPSPEREEVSKIYTKRDIQSIRDYLEFHGKRDWDEYKRSETGFTSKVSDEDFLAFLNGWKSTTGEGRSEDI